MESSNLIRPPLKSNKGKTMNTTAWIMLLLAAILTFIAYMKNPHLPLEGLKDGGKLFWDIFPALIFAFIIAGMISKVLPREVVTRWLGDESGFRGMILATVSGAVTPGGPYVQFPIVAALFKSGAGIAPLMVYISSWSLIGLNRFFVFEAPLLGWKLSLSRFFVSMLFPIFIGMLTRFLYVRLP